MKNNYLFFVCLILIIVRISSQEQTNSSATFSQNDDIIYPAISFEHPLHLDVFVSVVNCDGIPSLRIGTFNESRARKDIVTSFQITISDENGKSEVFNFPNKNYKFGEMLISNCSNLTQKLVSTLNWRTDNSTKKIKLKFDYEN